MVTCFLINRNVLGMSPRLRQENEGAPERSVWLKSMNTFLTPGSRGPCLESYNNLVSALPPPWELPSVPS